MYPSNSAHSQNIPYDPLPLTQDPPRDSIYSDPSSPHASGFDTPPVEMSQFSDTIPPSGAAQPRFLGAALYDDPSNSYRDSFASQNTQNTFRTAPSAINSSVYALNPEVERSSAYRDDPHDPEYNSGSGQDVGFNSPRYLAEKRSAYTVPRVKSKRGLIIAGSILAAVIVLIAVVVPIYFVVIKPKSSSNNSSAVSPSNPTSTSTSTGQPSSAVVTGGNGSTITMEDGTTFTYSNPFGGTWYWNPDDPFNNNAQAQSWTPPLNQTFSFGTDKIFGVNLGGWLNTEPFMQVYPRCWQHCTLLIFILAHPLFIRNTLKLSMSGR
ncbi:uncharacterized protein BJ212DRAFT_1055248 [Suillus subaureus]|uniref:Uncharacterized protein n=1 Tax=Suillus subaureus TaxID=48587 RepID=A0A9P7EEL1_9AGAM|nr:uncharacterized protein BJ212DRAFT_1055248 [Suillus subaureus]KAG1819604.1 hypothetical protein BJ212DRAFT_1055248 [Suillus subaureus]